MGYTIEELINIVQCDLTISDSIPRQIPDREIERIIETHAAPWFYQWYPYSLQKAYLRIDREALLLDEFTKYSRIQLPCQVQNMIWLYQINIGNGRNLFNAGFGAPVNAINTGISNTPMLGSYVTTLAELGTYNSVIQNFADMIDQFSKFTLKYDYNENTNRLHILTNVHCHDLIAEAWIRIEREALYGDPEFIRYVTSLARIQMGNLLGFYDYTLAGNVKINYAEMLAQGKEEKLAIEERIKAMSPTSWFFMAKR